MSHRLKIAVITTMAESPWGGSEELWAQMLKAALDEGHECMALIPKWNPRVFKVQALVDSGLKLEEWTECNTSLDHNCNQGRPHWYPYHPIAEFAPDMICISHGGLLDVVNGHILLIQMLLELNLDYTLVIQANTDLYYPNDGQRKILQHYFTKAKRIFFVSRQNLEIARRQLAMPLEHAEVINNPVNLDSHGYVQWPQSRTALLASVARFDTWAKGHDILLEVLSQEKWKSRDWKLRLFGKGIHENYIREMIDYFKLSSYVEIPGHNWNVRQIWEEHQLLILASRLEGTPLVLFEAMLCGRPAVVTDVGGNADWVQDGKNGFVAKAATVTLLDEALEKAWLNRENWNSMGLASREYFLSKHEIYSGKTLLKKLLSLCDTSEYRNMSSPPKISVIIPCYNYARYLEDAVSSVIAQTYQDFEIIIVNDGSTDNTVDVAEMLVAKYPDHSIRFINQVNSGQPAISRNNGILVSQGRYIFCLDADDMIAPTMLEECLKLLESCPEIAIAYTDRLDFDGIEGVVQAGEYDFSRLIYANHISYCALYRREVWEQVGGYRDNVKAVEDWDFWIAAGAKGYFGKRIPLPLFKYRRHDTGIFQDALKDFDRKQAQIFINNAAFYDPALIVQAEKMLGTATRRSPLVSVIVPTHNRPDMLKGAIQSVLDQTFQDFEIIVINDAGQDVSSVVQSFNSPKITYLSHEINKGLAAARNTGIRAAGGKYIAYLDDDDTFYPDHLETLVNTLEESDYKVAYADAYRATQQKDGEHYTTIRKDCPYSSDFDYDLILTENFIPVLCIVHEKSCIDDVGMFDESLPRHEDWDLWIRMSRAYRFVHIPRITCEYTLRLDGSGMVSGSVPSFLHTFTRICEKYRNLTDHRPEIVAARVQRRFQMLFDVYNFLGVKIDALSGVDVDSPSEELFCTLRKTGATDAEIASAFYQQAGIHSADMPERAAAFFYKALDADPDNVIARRTLAETLLKMGDNEGAVRQVERLIEQNPYDSGLVGSLARYFPGRDDQKALFFLERLIQLSPDDLEAVRFLKEVKERLGIINAVDHSAELPLKVGVYSLDAPGDACAAIRITGPLAIFGDRVQLLWGAVSDGSTCTTSLDKMNEADLIIVQRFYPRQGTLPFLEKILTSGKPVVYEVDDLLTDLPETNHLRPWAKETADILETVLPRFSAITVSTPQLAERLGRYNRNTFVLPNLIDEKLFHFVPRNEGGPVVIGFCGTGSHARDLELIEGALFRIAEKYGDQVAFVFMGHANSRHLTLPGFVFHAFKRDYSEYAHALSGSGIDIALVPLEDNPFNRCKSNIKWLEYSACGIAGIYADLPPYNTSVVQGETGLLVGSDPETWFQAISFLIDRPDLRFNIAQKARSEVLAKYTITNGAHRWLDFYGEIMKRHFLSPDDKRTVTAKRPRFSILILTWNRARMLEKCLSSLFSNLANRDDCEIIVGDNGSTDDTASVIDRFTVDARVKFPTNQGINGYRELFNRASGEYIICIDDDVLELPLSFELRFVEYFAAFPDYGMLGLDVVQNEHTNGAKPGPLYYHPTDTRGGISIEEGPVIGCCFCVRSETFNLVGGLGNAELTVGVAHDATLYRNVIAAGLRTGIIAGVRCFHASGPFYSAEHGYLDQDIEKYRIARLPGMVEQYTDFKNNPVSSQFSLQVKISIIIPVFNQLHFTRQCLDKLFATLPTDLSCEIIVVDNASTDGTDVYLRSIREQVRVITNAANLGFSRACNLGAEVAKGDYLLFLNNDTEPQTGWLEPLVAGIEQDGADIVGAKLLYPDGTIQHAGVVFDADGLGKHIFKGLTGESWLVNKKRFMQCVTGACMLVKESLFTQLQGFDELFLNGFEDVDLCLRANHLGKKILYVPESVLIHHEGRTEGRSHHEDQNLNLFKQRWNGNVVSDEVTVYEELGLAPIGIERAEEWFSTLGSSIDSLDIFIQIFNRYPDDVGAITNISKTLKELGDHTNAQRFLDFAIELSERPKPAISVSIIIPVFNEKHFTHHCLESLFATMPKDLSYEIIVVDNASSDGTGEYLNQLGDRIRLISNTENQGFAKACNQGARAARGKLILFLNNDTVPKPGWIEALTAAFNNDEADICGSRLLYPDGKCQHAGVAFDERGLGYHIFGGFPGDAAPVMERRRMQAVTGACLMARKSLFVELGGFDEGYRNGFEDVDFCLRAGELGKRILYVPESAVLHYAEQSSGRKDQDVPNMQRFFARWHGKVRQDDQELYARFGLTCRREPDGRMVVVPAAKSAAMVSIIIPLFNKVELTRACLLALERNTARESYELVLVDNNSNDGTVTLLREWEPKATILRNSENKGFAAACNQGVRAATGKYLLFLNNDTEVKAGWLEPLVATLDSDLTVAAVGSKLLFPDGTLQHAGVVLVNAEQNDPLIALHRFIRFAADYPPATIPWQMQALTAACLLVRRERFEAVGGFDEGYWNGYEDVDLCLKLGQAGWKLVYQPASVVVHHESQSGPERFSKVQHNITRLHERWLNTVSPDLLMAPDNSMQLGPAMLQGVCAPYKGPDLTHHTLQADQAVAVGAHYPLIPLVGKSASSILQKLSSSQRAKGVLKRYTLED